MACVKLNKTEEELRNTQEKLEEKINNLETKYLMQCLEEQTWKISGYSKMLRQVELGKEHRIDSVPFYTRAYGRYGYKFKLRLSLSYIFFTKILSVYFVIMKGEYDSILPWPFHRKVTFTLVDQQGDLNERKNIVKSITPDPTNDEKWNKRPVTDENTEKSFERPVFEFELTDRRFIVDDTIFLQITVFP